MSADTTFSMNQTPTAATLSDNSGGGAGRGGSNNPAQGPLVVVQPVSYTHLTLPTTERV